VATREQRLFCEALGISVGQVRVERVAHPTKRAHTVFRVSHSYFGDGVAQLERDAWQKFFDEAQRKEPRPDKCQGTTKKGAPCASGPQKGERYCGPHLAAARKRGDA